MPALGEFELIDRYFRRDVGPGVELAIGDDAAIVTPAGPIAVAVDTIVAGSHFPDNHPPDAVGHRALAVNLSDLAAVGATPRWATLALSLPSADSEWIEAFANGWFALAERFGVDLIGGDTTRGPLTATVQVIGDAPNEPLLRSAGRQGDLIFVSGTLGDSAGAVDLVTRADAPEGAGRSDEASADRVRKLLARFSYPEPRVDLGKALVGVGHAAIDVSDGLLADLGHICRASALSAEIDVDAVPVSAELDSQFGNERARELALGGGDDYELCFTAAPGERQRVIDIAGALNVPVTEIGQLIAGDAGSIMSNGRPVEIGRPGFTHF